jgi:replication initiation protein RepC
MEPYRSTTPFGRRPLAAASIAAQAVVLTDAVDKAVHKWHVFRAVCAARMKLGVTERSLSVLNALLTFHPETALTGRDLIVFPSNYHLSLRAHGMAPATLRRHLAALVEAGLIIRRDSPNGKRFIRKGRAGETDLAFGFDISPLVARADEFQVLADEVSTAARNLKLVRERITLCRRDITKMIAAAEDQGIAPALGSTRLKDWQAVRGYFSELLQQLPAARMVEALEPIAEELSMLAEEIFNILEGQANIHNMSAKESHNDHHIQNSKTEPLNESEKVIERIEGEQHRERSKVVEQLGFPLSSVLSACPDIADYHQGEIRDWRTFVATAGVIRPMLGISPSAWNEACEVMGAQRAAIVLAAILQRSEAIKSAGGYLRNLTQRAAVNEFSIAPMLFALMKPKASGAREQLRE